MQDLKLSTVENCLHVARHHKGILEMELLLAHVLDVTRESIFAHPKRILNRDEQLQLHVLWSRLQFGEPVAYLMNRKEFYGHSFYVDERVLIPRPETEHLVDAVLGLAPQFSSPRILDMGTGCGAIALALQSALPTARVFASDISVEALQVAQKNAHAMGLHAVDFFVSDLLCHLPEDACTVDIVVANLPYIGTECFDFVEKSVELYEPHLALFGGSDGLELYRRFFHQISCSKNKPSFVLGEFGSFQSKLLEILIHDFLQPASFEFYRDLAGLDRFFVLGLTENRVLRR